MANLTEIIHREYFNEAKLYIRVTSILPDEGDKWLINMAVVHCYYIPAQKQGCQF